jgi:hypothetical protein
MHRFSRLFAWGLLLGVLPCFGVQAVTPDGCKASYAIKPLDESVVTLLGDAVVPSKQTVFVDQRLQQLQAFDFPSKVTAWADRPAPAEMTSRRAALIASSAGGKGAPAGSLQPYLQRPIPAKDFADLEKWFAKEAPKKVQGLCVDPAKASYVLAVGVIAEGNQAGPDNSMARTQYDQSITRQADRSVGPNAATVTPGGGDRPSDELSALASGGPSLPGVHTCVYLYRARQAVPDYYYCSADIMPKSTVTTMLKFIAKTGVK